jgi:integrase/recombinase XerD
MLIDLSRVRVSGPLSTFAPGFADHLTRQGYQRSAARRQMCLLKRLSNWLAGEALGVNELRTNEVERFLRDRRAAGCAFLLSTRAMQPILSYLRGLGVAPAHSSSPSSSAVEAILERYQSYLAVERGVRNTSACRYIGFA